MRLNSLTGEIVVAILFLIIGLLGFLGGAKIDSQISQYNDSTQSLVLSAEKTKIAFEKTKKHMESYYSGVNKKISISAVVPESVSSIRRGAIFDGVNISLFNMNGSQTSKNLQRVEIFTKKSTQFHGVNYVKITLYGTYNTLKGFSNWMELIKKHQGAITFLKVYKNTFNMEVKLYGQ